MKSKINSILSSKSNQKLFFAIIIYSVLSLLFLIFLYQVVDSYLKDQYKIKAKIMALAIESNYLSKLEHNNNDLTKDEYFHIKDQLKKI